MWPRTGAVEREHRKISTDDVDPRRGVHDIVQYMSLEGADMSRIDQRYNVNDAKTDMAWKKYLQQEQRYFNQNKRANNAYLSRFDTVADLKTGLFGGEAKAFKSRIGLETVAVSDVPKMSEDYAVGIGITSANTFHAVADPLTGEYVRKGSDFGWYDDVSELDQTVIDKHGNFRRRPYNYASNDMVTLGSFGPSHAVVESITNELDADVDLLVERRPPVRMRSDPVRMRSEAARMRSDPVRMLVEPIRLSMSPAENSLVVEAGPMNRSFRPVGSVVRDSKTGSYEKLSKPMKMAEEPLGGRRRPKKTSSHFMADWFFIFTACIVLFAIVGIGLSV
jgi:hypothetical protein